MKGELYIFTRQISSFLFDYVREKPVEKLLPEKAKKIRNLYPACQ
jgi:hypothetical protein